MKKILNFFARPYVLIALWVIFLITPFLSSFRLNYVVEKNLFGLHKVGASSFILYFPFLISGLIFFTLIVWLSAYFNEKLSSNHRRALKFLSLLSAIFLLCSRLLLIQEENSYPNFLYARYGITFSQLELMSFISALQLLFFLCILLYDFAIDIKKVVRVDVKRASYLEKSSLLLALFGLSCLTMLGVYAVSNLPFTLRDEKKGYESKAGVHYKYIKLMAEHIPEKAKVIHPPQGEKWPAIGNQPLIRFFLFPRTLISGALMNGPELAAEISEAYFTEIDPQDGPSHWPEIYLKDKSIVFDESTKINYKSLKVVFESQEGRVFKVNF